MNQAERLKLQTLSSLYLLLADYYSRFEIVENDKERWKLEQEILAMRKLEARLR